MQCVVLVDFGSTYTKAAVIEKEQEKVLYTTKHPSTVKVDASIALDQCLFDIENIIGADALSRAEIHASSSAAGGLRMAVVGLTERLSVSAGKNLAYGSGAKIVSVMAGRLGKEEIEELSSRPLEMILFCGGYEKGNTTVLLHNAQMLAEGQFSCPVIYGGNSFVAKEVRHILKSAGKECFLIPNIIPEVGKLETAQGEAMIRDLFMSRITNMKGLSKVKKVVGEEMIPTPKAVLEAGNLLSTGYGSQKGYGDLMIVDIGGATTDIHSYGEHMAGKGARLVGAKEPYAKRTVEGDLGMRESSDALIQDPLAEEILKKWDMDPEQVKKSIENRMKNTEFLPDSSWEEKLDEIIASYGAAVAARRHVGRLELTLGKGNHILQMGKSLHEVQLVVGTGGPIINSRHPEDILKNVLKSTYRTDEHLLLPEKASFLVDSDYILYAAGILSQYDRELAFRVMEHSLSLK